VEKFLRENLSNEENLDSVVLSDIRTKAKTVFDISVAERGSARRNGRVSSRRAPSSTTQATHEPSARGSPAVTQHDADKSMPTARVALTECVEPEPTEPAASSLQVDPAPPSLSPAHVQAVDSYSHKGPAPAGSPPTSSTSNSSVTINMKKNASGEGGDKDEFQEAFPSSDTQINLNPDQQAVLELAVKGYNLFIGGCAGTGKTITSLSIIRTLRDIYGKNVLVTASTGLAAARIGGVTFHHAFGVRRDGSWSTYKKLDEKLRSVHTILVDEVSMLTADLLETLDTRMRKLKANERRRQIRRLRSSAMERPGGEGIHQLGAHQAEVEDPAQLPFGGVQVILCGDFLQLEAIDGQSMMHSPLFKAGPQAKGTQRETATAAGGEGSTQPSRFGFLKLALTQQIRQVDPVFAAQLQQLRVGILSPSLAKELGIGAAQGSLPLPSSPAVPSTTEDATHLFSTNREAAKMNAEKLHQLPGAAKLYSSCRLEPLLSQTTDQKWSSTYVLTLADDVVISSNATDVVSAPIEGLDTHHHHHRRTLNLVDFGHSLQMALVEVLIRNGWIKSSSPTHPPPLAVSPEGVGGVANAVDLQQQEAILLKAALKHFVCSCHVADKADSTTNNSRKKGTKVILRVRVDGSSCPCPSAQVFQTLHDLLDDGVKAAHTIRNQKRLSPSGSRSDDISFRTKMQKEAEGKEREREGEDGSELEPAPDARSAFLHQCALIQRAQVIPNSSKVLKEKRFFCSEETLEKLTTLAEQHPLLNRDLTLKVGARVMLRTNLCEKLPNGMIGRVVGFTNSVEEVWDTIDKYNLRSKRSWHSDQIPDGPTPAATAEASTVGPADDPLLPGAGAVRYRRDFPIVQFEGFPEPIPIPLHGHTVGGDRQTDFFELTVLAVPLDLAYAFTVHKVQGMTLTGKVSIDFSSYFSSKSLVYVALSRVKHPSQLVVKGLKPWMIKACSEAKALERTLRNPQEVQKELEEVAGQAPAA
jgi:hypothetical protein